MVKTISLTNSNELVLVDNIDYEYLIQWNWQLCIRPTNKFIQRCQRINNIKYVFIISRVIAERMNLDLTNEIDHIDRNPLNNQRDNLRSATKSQNKANTPARRNNTTGFKGVTFHPGTQKYRAQIMINKKLKHLGLFVDPENAAKAYDKAAKLYFGEFAYLNFPTKE